MLKSSWSSCADTVWKSFSGIRAGAVLPIYDELYKNADRLRHVITAHEQGASHAADGYARVSGKVGVVLATSGPGATNLVTGIANAYLDSVPLVAITWTVQNYPFRQTRRLLTSGGLGTMGYGMGAAMGGCIANGRKRTVLFTGDGSFGMNLNELATAVRENLPLLVVIFHNGVLGMVRQWQTLFYHKHYSQTTLSQHTDFVKLAEAFGAVGMRVQSVSELQEILHHLPEEGPVVLDCRIGQDEFVLPMIPPGGTAGDMMTRKPEELEK